MDGLMSETELFKVKAALEEVRKLLREQETAPTSIFTTALAIARAVENVFGGEKNTDNSRTIGKFTDRAHDASY
jgi:hypothetical protein